MTSSYAHVYRPPPQHQSYLTREQKRERKRKREANRSDDEEHGEAADPAEHEAEAEDEADAPPTPRVAHAVSKIDPYYVAGLSRADSPPGGYFPHARIPETKEKLILEEELAKLNPPLYVPNAIPDNQDGSLRRRHLDNLTAILHKCLQTSDWQRASRAWGLILRTEIQGRGVDVRHHGRWAIGAEILMRRRQGHKQDEQSGSPTNSASDDRQQMESQIEPRLSNDGFRMAREYYERLILQYPHMPRQSHATVNALAIYPALFNVWIFEVQSRATLAGKNARRSSTSTNSDAGSSPDRTDTSEYRAQSRQVKADELEQAIPIAQRMDEVMLNPPYDKSAELLHLRAMVALWLVDLSKIISRDNATSSGEEDTSSSDLQEPATLRRDLIARERRTAKRVMNVMVSLKMEVPDQLASFFEDYEAVERDDE